MFSGEAPFFHSQCCPHVIVLLIIFTDSSVVSVSQMKCWSALKKEWTYLRVFSLIKWQSADVPSLSAFITSQILKRHVGLLKLISVLSLSFFYFLLIFGLSHESEICAQYKASLLWNYIFVSYLYSPVCWHTKPSTEYYMCSSSILGSDFSTEQNQEKQNLFY